MNELVNIEVVRDEALRKLGRNIVHFSKIEAILKRLLSVSQLKGTEKTISDHSLENKTKPQKPTLGKLVEKFHKNILVDASKSEPIPDYSRAEISISFKVIYNNPDFLKVQKSKLNSIVAERNKLIHQDLGFVDISSVEDCHNLISLLDEQNFRLLAQLEELRLIMESLINTMKASEYFLKSPDFLQMLQLLQSDASPVTLP
jgi:hypothetical protein